MILNKPSLLAMAERWPSAFVSRTEIDRFTGGALNAKYSAWLDSQGKGIKDRIRIGRRIIYPVPAVLEFLEARAEFVEKK